MANQIYVIEIKRYPMGQKPPFLGQLIPGGSSRFRLDSQRDSKTVARLAIIMDDAGEAGFVGDVDSIVDAAAVGNP